MIYFRKMKVEIIYKLDGVNAEDGVDVFEIAPVLMNFGELVRSANSTLGYEQKIDVRVKPFEKGSWVTQFIFDQSTVKSLLTYLGSDEGKNLMTVLGLLGISNVKSIVTGVSGIVRWTKGKVNNFTKNEERNTVTYISPSGEKLEVTMAEHRLVQSPLIQNNYYNCIVAPFDKFPTTTGITFETKEGLDGIKKFTEDDKTYFEEYARTTLLDEAEENLSMLNGVFLKPKRGSYSGEEKAYSFIMGDNTILWPVTIDDKSFLEQLTKGEIRLYHEDVLKVDLEIKQKKDSTNRMLSTYVVKRVVEYIQFKRPQQLEF